MNPPVAASWHEPMLAQPTRVPDQLGTFRQGDWLYERKLDGLRCLAVRNGAQVELWSRNRLSFTGRFPQVVSALRSLPGEPFVLDGEVVAFDGERTSFTLLQNPSPATQNVYSVFDLLHLLGRDVRHLTLEERADLLTRTLAEPADGLRLTERVGAGPTGPPADAASLLATACGHGWEGLIAKRASSPYRAGRSPDWRKLKCSARQELVVAGWTDPSGARTGFGALLVGYYDDRQVLRYAGRVGTGFDEKQLRRLHDELVAIEVDRSPFEDRIPEKAVHWARPEMVAEVEFTEWTRDGRLRHPRFVGIRPDKSPADVVRET